MRYANVIVIAMIALLIIALVGLLIWVLSTDGDTRAMIPRASEYRALPAIEVPIVR